MRVLVVVDDDPNMRELVCTYLMDDDRLEMSGVASTAMEAVEQALRWRPDLVVLDHFIDGDIMGIDAAPLLKSAVPSAKVLLFTDHDLAVEAAREPAIDAFLSKRQLSELLGVVQELLGMGAVA